MDRRCRHFRCLRADSGSINSLAANSAAHGESWAASLLRLTRSGSSVVRVGRCLAAMTAICWERKTFPFSSFLRFGKKRKHLKNSILRKLCKDGATSALANRGRIFSFVLSTAVGPHDGFMLLFWCRHLPASLLRDYSEWGCVWLIESN